MRGFRPCTRLPRDSKLLKPRRLINPAPSHRNITTLSRNVHAYNDDRRRIHFLGLNSRTVFLAVKLSLGSNPPPITIITHIPYAFKTWNRAGQKLKLYTDDVLEVAHDVEIQYVPSPSYISQYSTMDFSKQIPEEATRNNQSPIKNLIWTSKGSYAFLSLSLIQHRLGPESTVLCLNDTMGLTAKAIANLFPMVDSRPVFYEGFSRHVLRQKVIRSLSSFMTAQLWDVKASDPPPLFETYRIVGGESASEQALCIGPAIEIPSEKTIHSRLRRSRYLIERLSQSAEMDVCLVSKFQLLRRRWSKLFIDAICGSLSAVLGCRVPMLLEIPEARRRMQLLFNEAYFVAKNMLPGLSREDCSLFLTGYLDSKKDDWHRQAARIASGRAPEVEFSNQWLVDRATYLGLPCAEHAKLISELSQKAEEKRLEVDALFEARQVKQRGLTLESMINKED